VASPELNSLRNPRVSKARRLATRSHREAERRFLVEGPSAVREALREATDRPAGSPGRVDEIFVTAEAMARHRDIVALAEGAGTEIIRSSGEVVAALSGTVTPQGMVAVVTHLDQRLSDLPEHARLVALLSLARDPGNAGTIIRTADAVGADAVVLTDASVDPYNGKCVRASVGSLFHLPIVRGVVIEEAIDHMRAAGLQVLAADGTGSTDVFSLAASGALVVPTVWVFGNEAWGIPPETQALADAVVRVPIYGRAESLNLATAASVCLYASAQAQRAASS